MGAVLTFFFFAVLYVACIVFAIQTENNQTHALQKQCHYTANTLQARTFNFENENNKCNIVTADGKLVSF